MKVSISHRGRCPTLPYPLYKRFRFWRVLHVSTWEAHWWFPLNKQYCFHRGGTLSIPNIFIMFLRVPLPSVGVTTTSEYSTYTRYIKPARFGKVWFCHQGPPPLLPEDPPADKGRCYSCTPVLGTCVMLVIILCVMLVILLYLKANKAYLLAHSTRRTTWSLTC